MTSKVTYLGSLRTECEHVQSGTRIITDAPVDNHGKGASFSPTDTLATSLASCMLTVAGIKAEASGFSIDGTTAEVLKTMAANPRRISEISIVFNFPQSYDETARRVIENACNTCPVKMSLHPDMQLNISFNYK